jgi:hypothetical protein
MIIIKVLDLLVAMVLGEVLLLLWILLLFLKAHFLHRDLRLVLVLVHLIAVQELSMQVARNVFAEFAPVEDINVQFNKKQISFMEESLILELPLDLLS